MIYILFVYGLSFFSFGLALLLYPKQIKGVRFVKHLWLISAFGLAHGTSEWLDMFKLINGANADILNPISFVILPLSYAFVLYFAIVVIFEHYKKNPYLYAFVILFALACIYIYLSFQNSNTYLAANVWARYLFGVFGILLGSYAIYLQRDNVNTHISYLSKSYLTLLSLNLFVYGILSGFIVPKSSIYLSTLVNQATFIQYTGLPVQLFRALFAISLAIYSLSLLKELQSDMQIKLTKLSKAIDVSGDSVIITDIEGNIQYTNPAFEKETGYVLSEILGKPASILKSGSQDNVFYKNLWDTILSGKIFREYFINKKKNGEIYNEYKAIAPIMDANGKISNFVSTGKNVTERMLLEKKLEKLASTDRLTHIANRSKFDEMLKSSIDRAKRYKVNLSLILFDIDDFKKVNDTFGHLTGDEVLKKVANIAGENIRQSDFVARWGGEEFMIIQPDISSEEASTLAERLRLNIETASFPRAQKITVSFGVTTFLKSDSIDSFLSRVDKALYSAKTTGKNKIVQI
jgi:diguanylate cyclase (GGDEF)-like protein/PAS domain S-box-containing protein